jgi:hypothetical protein
MIEDLFGKAIEAARRGGAYISRLYIAHRATVCRADDTQTGYFR